MRIIKKIIKTILISLIAIVVLAVAAGFYVYSGIGKRPEEIKAVAHRGYSTEAPENTLPAFRLAKEKGFDYVECDVVFTSDNVPVLLHDDSINRTSNGEGKISSLTYEEVSQYDFGSWFSEEYAGVKIPTFDEFLKLCKELELHPYIELKGSYSKEQIDSLVADVEENGMKGNVSWISFDYDYLVFVKEADDTARLGFLSSEFEDEDLELAISLRTGKNEVFLDLGFMYTFSWCIRKCKEANMPVEVWTLDMELLIMIMHPYISGVTSNFLVADEVLGRK